MANWYKKAKVGEKYLQIKEIPDSDIPAFMEYINAFPETVQKYLIKKLTPKMTLEQLKAIPIEVKETQIDPKMEKVVSQMTDDKEEREWLRKLVVSGQFKEEDKIKLFLMLKELHELPEKKQKPISSFKDDVELSKYLKEFSIHKDIKLPQGGYELLEDYHTDAYNVKMFHITNQQALDAIGGNANWCVLSKKGKVNYSPFDYYCFVIDGEPEVLIHLGSGQIKDSNDGALRYGPFIKAIAPAIDKHKLSPHSSYHRDFTVYSQNLENVKVFEANKDNEQYISDEINKDPYNILMLDENRWGKYMPILAKHVKELSIDDLNSNLLNYLASYAKLNDPKVMEELENKVMLWFDATDSNLTTGRYKNKIPTVLRTQKINKLFNEQREIAISRWEKSILEGYEATDRIQECPFKEITDTPDIWFKLLTLDEMKDGWQNIWNSCPFEEVKKDPYVIKTEKSKWNQHLSQGTKHLKHFINKDLMEDWEDCPFEDIKNKPEVLKAVKQAWKDSVNFKRDDYYANFYMSEDTSKWKKFLKECPFPDLKEDPDIKKYFLDSVKKHLNKPSYGSSLSLSDSSFLSRLLGVEERGWHWHNPNDVPVYSEDPNIIPTSFWKEVASNISPNLVPLHLVREKNGIGKLLKDSPDFGKQIVLLNPENYINASEEIKKDPEVKQVAFEYFKKKIMQDVTKTRDWSNIPFGEQIKQDKQFRQFAIQQWDKHLIQHPEDFSKCWLEEINGKKYSIKDIDLAKNLTEKKEIMNGLLEPSRRESSYYKKNLLNDPSLTNFINCRREEVKKDPEVIKAVVKYGKQDLMSENPQYRIQDYHMLPQIQNDPEVWKHYLISRGTAYQANGCPIEEVKKDPEVWKAILLRDISQISFCPVEEVKNDPTVKNKAIEYWTELISLDINSYNPQGLIYTDFPFKSEILHKKKPEIIGSMKQKVLEIILSATTPEEKRIAKQKAWGYVNTFIFKQELLLDQTVKQALSSPNTDVRPQIKQVEENKKKKQKTPTRRPWQSKDLLYPPYHEQEDNPFPENKPIPGSYQEYLMRQKNDRDYSNREYSVYDSMEDYDDIYEHAYANNWYRTARRTI